MNNNPGGNHSCLLKCKEDIIFIKHQSCLLLLEDVVVKHCPLWMLPKNSSRPCNKYFLNFTWNYNIIEWFGLEEVLTTL